MLGCLVRLYIYIYIPTITVAACSRDGWIHGYMLGCLIECKCLDVWLGVYAWKFGWVYMLPQSLLSHVLGWINGYMFGCLIGGIYLEV